MKVLIAEDDLTSRMILSSNLKKWGIEVIEVTNGLEAMEALSEPGAAHLAVLDRQMPEMDGLEVCRRVRAGEKAESEDIYTYIILLTGCSEAEDVVEGMNAGADDYLTKPYNIQELNARIKAGRRIVELQQALLEARNKLRELSMHDALTGILNRRALLERLGEEMARAARERYPLAVAVLDIDFFKKINDTHGHNAGDEVLREFVGRVGRNVRSYDILGRYGGEEFILILIKTTLEKARIILERVRSAVEGEPFVYEEKAIGVTVSIGGAAWDGGGDSAALIERADKALYRAKEGGRNRVVLAEED